MAIPYKFGQFRSSQSNSYMRLLDYTFDDKRVESSLSKGTVFLDKAIELSGDNQLQKRSPQGKLRNFFLRFKVYKSTESQVFDIILRNTSLVKDNSQTIGTIQVEIGDEKDFSVFDFVISPNENRVFNQIHFELQRVLKDFETERPDGTYGRIPKIEIEILSEINNLIDILNPSIDNKGVLKQIGVQSAPGLVMCINGEQIKVGRSGLYEIKNGIEVNFIGFVVEDGRYFILDYQY